MGDLYKPTGKLQGDSTPMRDAGTGTGLNGDTYGAELAQDATNRMGGIGGSSKSDPALNNNANRG